MAASSTSTSALVGTRPKRNREPAYGRDSNMLRASVLDVALELGVGTSRAVENLIFDSILEDDENVTTPSLTSASAATSDESWPSVPPWSVILTEAVPPDRNSSNVTPTLTSEGEHAKPVLSADSHMLSVPRPSQPRKLRKARKDSHESDGDYLSDNSRQKQDGKERLTFESDRQADGGYLPEATKAVVDKKKKQKGKKGKKASDDLDVNPLVKAFPNSRMPSDDGDLSDGTHISDASVKKKKTFFGLRSRSPSVPRKGVPVPIGTPPPVPALPPAAPNFPDGSPVWDEPPVRKGWFPLPPSDILRSLSIDANTEESAQTRAPLSYVPRPQQSESHASQAHSRKQAPAPALSPYGVRFPPSTRSTSSDMTLPQHSSPAVAMTSEKPPRPTTIPSSTSHMQKASPSPAPPSPVPPALRTVSPMPVQPNIRPVVPSTFRSTPSPLMLTPSTSLSQRGPSPSLSELSIISSSEFIVPSPRARFFEDLPPPSPPPTCPLPELPPPSPYSQLNPLSKRGRQPPFPTRGTLPVQDAPRPTDRAERRRQEALQMHLAEGQAGTRTQTMGDAIGDDVYGGDQVDHLLLLAGRVNVVPPSPPRNQIQEDDYDWPDDESVRPEFAQFHPYTPPATSGGVRGVASRPFRDERDDEYVFPHVTSSSSADVRASAMTRTTDSDVHSYYFGEPDRGDDERVLHAGIVNDEPDRRTRARLLARADVLFGTEEIPPVPKLQPF